MKKTIIAIALIAGSSWLGATALTTGGKTAIANGTCGMVATTETANVQLSKDVVGAYDCTATTAGVATAHPGGKGRTYGASSNGGKLIEGGTTEFASATAASTAAATAATAAMNAS